VGAEGGVTRGLGKTLEPLRGRGGRRTNMLQGRGKRKKKARWVMTRVFGGNSRRSGDVRGV